MRSETGIEGLSKSKKYKKNGITVVLLRGSPFEMGFARGTLLKKELKQWTEKALSFIRGQDASEEGGRRGRVADQVERAEKEIPK